MKLFTKMLLGFIGAVIVQSSLTIGLLTNMTRRDNYENALKELKAETQMVRENYMAWKRNLWKLLIDIHQSPPSADWQALTADWQHAAKGAGIDVILLRFAGEERAEMLPISVNHFSPQQLAALKNRKPHPYMELRFIGQQLCLIGLLNMPAPSSADASASHLLEMFLIKRIDPEFCQKLVLNRRSHAAFFSGAMFVSGTRHAPLERDVLTYRSAAPIYRIEMERLGENTAFQSVETLENEQRLFLRVAVSNAGYIRRVAALEQALWLATVLSAVLSVVCGFFISSTITRPLRKLLDAMQKIRAGVYDTALELRLRGEIGELVRGFNEMARTLHWDKEQMHAYIHEITVLKDYNENIIQSIRAGMVIINAALRVEKVNSAFLHYVGLEDVAVIGQPAQEIAPELFDAEMVAQLRAILRNERQDYSKIFRRQPHQVYEMKCYPISSHEDDGAASSAPMACVVVLENISKKLEFEEKIFQAEKLSSISMLSAGVAHEINNPLGSIMTNVQNLIDDETDEDKRVSLHWIEKETRRIATIVKHLLDFSSSHQHEPLGADVNHVVNETLTLISYSLKKTQKIDLVTDFAEGLPFARISPDELKQVMINLLKNAMQAIEQHGTITIRTGQEAQNGQIVVMVEDTGIGIPEERLPRIFDPFYTTKNGGEGTGLGLSVVYGILNKYEGTISVSSQVAVGTQIRLAIPMQACDMGS